MFNRAEQIGSADHQTVLPDGDLPELAELFEQAGKIGSAPGLPGECSAGGDLAATEMVQPLSTARAVRGNHPAADGADNLDLHGLFDGAPAAVLELTNLAKLGNAELIAQAKAAPFPRSSKWAKSRPLGKKTRVQVIAFLAAVERLVG